MSSPTMRYAWNYSKDSESAKKQIFDPNDKELENSLMAGLALYDMNSFSESFITYLKKKAETTDVTDKSNLSEQINVCLELIKKIQKEPKRRRAEVTRNIEKSGLLSRNNIGLTTQNTIRKSTKRCTKRRESTITIHTNMG